MKVKRFFAPDMRQAMKLVRDEFGSDAAILSNNKVAGGVEIVTAVDYDNNILSQSTQSLADTDTLTESLAEALSKARDVIDNAGKESDSIAYSNTKDRSAQNDQQAEALVDSLGRSKRRSSSEDAAVRAMQSEIQGLRELLREQMKESMAERKPVEAMMIKRLKRLGISERFSYRVLEGLNLSESEGFGAAWDKATSQIIASIQTVSGDQVDQGGVIALMGSTGIGKTTTIGKLAARYVLKYGQDSLALVTTDCYRVAAYEQLRTFGRILGVPVRVVDERHGLDATLKSLKSKALVLIDTAGLSAQDPNLKAQFDLLSSASSRIKKYLVLSATSQEQVMQSSYDVFQSQGLNGCIVTKLDEAESIGEVLSVLADNRLPLAYVADGQKIPDDIRLAEAQALVSRALELLERTEGHSSAVDR
ncbi:flagellar biosynthesis protein FlhF [Oceanospirillum multiglobuliferum]|uniref:Flagellar biosynthesis protein FlhF n=1 Tax=Oceanospirillum multiglobuliferum TaxID=64969 RepID=A0A1T4L5C2_9GAMM|nr:flagellar biosynthesis protein FlhF [Oceanospirillum multiglobuliferum]OPX56798.1 flagellar biosynthesis protein FlhF [Oceanospirillum multiglobuliferum]SJZ49751.1 flagellar biosynthesis protein FlhF [Oceanospirillum multiglobuliferum]